VARITLAIGVYLEDPVRLTVDGRTIGGQASLAVPRVRLPDHAQAQLAGAEAEHGGRVAGGAIVDDAERRARDDRANRRRPLAQRALHRRPLVVDRHDDPQVVAHHRPWRSTRLGHLPGRRVTGPPPRSVGHGADEDGAALDPDRQTEARVERPAGQHVVEHDPPDRLVPQPLADLRPE